MKTSKEFNEKYKDFLEERYYGLAIENEEVIKYLDEQFQDFIKIPGFKYFQIKTKFNSVRFYSTIENPFEIEKNILEILNKEPKNVS